MRLPVKSKGPLLFSRPLLSRLGEGVRGLTQEEKGWSARGWWGEADGGVGLMEALCCC